MANHLFLGDEAVAQGALDAGIAGAFSYPGTPSTEIFEYILEKAQNGTAGPSARWSANEKVAYEEALGMSYAGRRSLVSMKHVGLNVAADPFVNSAITGVHGGLVLAVADDPSMHSSQNEQDSRYYGEFAKIPVFEPSNQQQAYDFTRLAFTYSEAIRLPVMVRITTRLAHSRAIVELAESEPASEHNRGLASGQSGWTLVPAIARRQYRALLEQQPQLLEDSEQASQNRLDLRGGRGIVTAGIAYNYVREVLGENHDWSLLHIGRYPIPTGKLRRLVEHCDDIIVIEEGYAFIETRMLGLLGMHGKKIRGKLSGDLPADGELTLDSVRPPLGFEVSSPVDLPIGMLAPRPPQLCKGCPHSDSFKALTEATAPYNDAVLFGDIGCYTLGVMPPYRAIHSCVDMGASISMAHGAAQAGVHPVVCTIGDSTFAHSGMTPLLGAAQADANMTVFVLDNAAVAMTGAQTTMLSDQHLVDVIAALGVSKEHLHVINPIPRDHDDNVQLIKRELAHQGLSVIIPKRPCVQLPLERRRAAQPATAQAGA